MCDKPDSFQWQDNKFCVQKERSRCYILWLSKAFNKVSYSIFIARVLKYGTQKIGWETGFEGLVSKKSIHLSHGSILSSILFNVFINNPICEMECTLSTFEDESKLTRMVHILKGRTATKRDLTETSWSSTSSKCNVVHMGRNKPMQQ